MWPFCIRKPCPQSHVRNGMQFPLTAPLGNSIPLRSQIPGRIFRQSPQLETASHSKGKFWDALSETPSIRKCVPLCIHPANACECVVQDGLVIGVMENVTPNACHGCAYECQEKSLENFEAFTFVLFCTKDRERRSYSPKTAFLAAAAMLSRSSLEGWSFAATQLSSSILNRALSGSCSSMAS